MPHLVATAVTVVITFWPIGPIIGHSAGQRGVRGGAALVAGAYTISMVGVPLLLGQWPADPSTAVIVGFVFGSLFVVAHGWLSLHRRRSR